MRKIDYFENPNFSNENSSIEQKELTKSIVDEESTLLKSPTRVVNAKGPVFRASHIYLKLDVFAG